MIPPLTLIDVQKEIHGIQAYKNIPLSLINNHIVRLKGLPEGSSYVANGFVTKSY